MITAQRLLGENKKKDVDRENEKQKTFRPKCY